MDRCNSEGYPDPTAAAALARVAREEKLWVRPASGPPSAARQGGRARQNNREVQADENCGRQQPDG